MMIVYGQTQPDCIHVDCYEYWHQHNHCTIWLYQDHLPREKTKEYMSVINVEIGNREFETCHKFTLLL